MDTIMSLACKAPTKTGGRNQDRGHVATKHVHVNALVWAVSCWNIHWLSQLTCAITVSQSFVRVSVL